MPDIFVKSGAKSVVTIPTSASFFAAFCKNPNNITFHSQEPDEPIILFLRAHFATNISWIATTILLVILPPLFFFFQISINIEFFSFSARLTNLSILFYYATVVTYAFSQFMRWYYNISIVTTKRIVDIDFSLLFHDVAITKIDLIEDVNYVKTGLFSSLFNFGNVFVQTAGEKVHFDFLAVPNPQKTADIIIDLIGKGNKHG